MRRFSLCLLWGVLVLCVAETAAQADVNIILYRDDDSLTLQILGSGPTPLADLRFEITAGQTEPAIRRLDSYPLFQRPLQSGEIFAPLCLRLERTGSQGLIPPDCQSMNLVIQELEDSQVFWRDPSTGRLLVVRVYAGATLALCSPQDPNCLFSYRSDVAASTPMIQASPSIRLGLPGLPITNNDSWLPFAQAFEGVEMALVPVGCFLMGAANGQENEAPLHEICFEQPFWIDRTEVTNLHYGGHGWWAESERPREVVSWEEALAHCEGRSMRLPTEAEWEYAARGPDNLIYPWGSEFDPQRVTFNNTSSRQTGFVGEKPNGASWVGALDMSGNVWEWVSTIDRPYPYDAGDGRENPTDLTSERTMRGGSWMDDDDVVTATFRRSEVPDFRLNNVGFRCARGYASEDIDLFTFAMRQPFRSEFAVRDAPTLRVLSGANLRQGPGVEFEVAGSARAGQYLEVIGRSSASDWYLVSDLDGQARWVSAGLIELQNVTNNEIPVARTAPDS